MKSTIAQTPEMTTRSVVPHITAWSAERAVNPRLVARRGGIAYQNELPRDRDSHGVLWRRVSSKQGVGRPEFGVVHSLRQRSVMRMLCCQVCAGPADRNHQGVLWLLKDHRNDWPGWPEGMGATHPPVCLPCARKSTRLCPSLRSRFVAVRVREPEIAGVYGALCHPQLLRPVKDVMAFYDDPVIRWTIAAQSVMALHGCTFTNINGG